MSWPLVALVLGSGALVLGFAVLAEFRARRRLESEQVASLRRLTQATADAGESAAARLRNVEADAAKALQDMASRVAKLEQAFQVAAPTRATKLPAVMR